MAARSSDKLLSLLTPATSFEQVTPFSWDKDCASTMAFDTPKELLPAIAMFAALKVLAFLLALSKTAAVSLFVFVTAETTTVMACAHSIRKEKQISSSEDSLPCKEMRSWLGHSR